MSLVVVGTSRDRSATRAVLTWAGFMARHLPHRGIGPVDDSDGVARGLFCSACGRGVVFRSTHGWPPVRITRVRVPLAALNGADR